MGRGLWVADDFPAAMVRAPLGLKAAGPETCPRRLCASGDGPAGDVAPADVRRRFAGGIHKASTGVTRYRRTVNRNVPCAPGSNTYTDCSPGRSCDSLTRRYCRRGRLGAGVWSGPVVAAGVIPRCGTAVACLVGLYVDGGRWLWYRRGAVCDGHRGGWRVWRPGRADAVHRPGRHARHPPR